MNLSEQTVLVTGGAGSIGSYLCEQLYPVVKKLIIVDKDQEKLDKLAAGFATAQLFCIDLVQPEKVEQAVKMIYENNPVSVVVNNAGFIHSEPLFNMLKPEDRKHSFKAWDDTIKANLYSTFYMTASATEQMISRKIKGLIINISSISAKGNMGQTAYSAAKSGIEAMTVTWSKELGIFGIRSAAVAPGFFDTASTRDSLSESNLKKWAKAVPLNRLGQLSELYTAIKFIIENDYYNGQTLEINGGLKI